MGKRDVVKEWIVRSRNGEPKTCIQIYEKSNHNWWVRRVDIGTGSVSVTSFEELFYELRAIQECEDRGYPKSYGFKGGDLLWEFAKATLKSESPWPNVAKRFNMPEETWHEK